MSNFTHGGLPSDQAWTWNIETYQKLGDVLFNLMSGNQDKRRKAHSNYWELKRHFMKDVFEEYVNLFDEYRISRGAVPLQKMVLDAGKEIVLIEPFPKVVPEAPVIVTLKEEVKVVNKVVKVEVVEQMELSLW